MVSASSNLPKEGEDRAFHHHAVAWAKEDAQCAVRIFLSRRNFIEGGCSMKITEDVRRYAAEQGLAEADVLESGMQEKRSQFLVKGAAVCAKV
jgi:hypothetical protein